MTDRLQALKNLRDKVKSEITRRSQTRLSPRLRR